MSSVAWRGRTLAALGIGAALAFLAAMAADLATLRLVSKPVPTLALAAWVALGPRGRFERRIAAGLLLSAVGDLLLELGLFLPGLLAFLAAHVAYVAAFLSATRRPAWPRAAPFLGWGAVVLAWLWPSLGTMSLPVLAYVAVICTMMWRAAAGVGSAGAPTTAEWLALAGAVLFAASDTLIALDRFRAPIEGVRGPIMLLYWAGQWGLAAAARLRQSPAPCGILPAR